MVSALLLVLGSLLTQNAASTRYKIVTRVEPSYSEEARRAQVNSDVLLDLIVDADGGTSAIKVKRSAGFGLDEEAIRAVEQWRFEPSTRNGVAVAEPAQIELTFRLLRPFNQTARLQFDTRNAPRPVLTQGRMPEPPQPPAHLRAYFSVTPSGEVEKVVMAECEPAAWGEAAAAIIGAWHFTASDVSVPAVLELAYTPK